MVNLGSNLRWDWSWDWCSGSVPLDQLPVPPASQRRSADIADSSCEDRKANDEIQHNTASASSGQSRLFSRNASASDHDQMFHYFQPSSTAEGHPLASTSEWTPSSPSYLLVAVDGTWR
jgi:hypothetical protein